MKRILDASGKTLVDKLIPDEVRLLKAISGLGSKHFDGLVLGIIENTEQSLETISLLINSLERKKMIEESFETGKRITSKGWNYIVQLNEEIKKEQALHRRLANGKA